ncbi:MAG: SMC-Scp complex subunit ScpB [Thermoguttaceae bacterium]
MKRSWLSLGRQLGSVAMRYRRSCVPRVSILADRDQTGGYRHWFGHQVHQQEKLAAPHDKRVSLLEAVFFLSQQPQSSRKLAQLAGLADGTKARTLVRTLNRRYDSEGSAFRIEEVAGGFQLMTRLKFAPWLRRLHSAPTEIRLSAPAMETLAVVAYRQPILRADIEAIRGVQSGEVLRQLIERDLVRIVGRSNELGRPFLYGTTKQFLQVFGLRHLDELPRADVLRTQRTSDEPQHNVSVASGDPDHTKPETIHSSNQAPVAEEETHVNTSITKEPRRKTFVDNQSGVASRPRHDDLSSQEIVAGPKDDKDEDYDEDLDEDDDEDEDEDQDDDLDEQPWEEVEDDDDSDEDEDEDEDWDDDDWDDDEDEDWDDDEDDDWDDDDEDEEEDEEEKE